MSKNVLAHSRTARQPFRQLQVLCALDVFPAQTPRLPLLHWYSQVPSLQDAQRHPVDPSGQVWKVLVVAFWTHVP